MFTRQVQQKLRLHPVILIQYSTDADDNYEVSKGTSEVIEKVKERIQLIAISPDAVRSVDPVVSHLYSSNLLPEYLEKVRDKNPQRWSEIVKEASEMVQVHGHLISAMIGKDVTKKDVREGTTFWSDRQSGRGPFLFRQIVETVLGGILWSDPTTHLLYRGPFRDVFECDEECEEWVEMIVNWFRLYLETGTTHVLSLHSHLFSQAIITPPPRQTRL